MVLLEFKAYRESPVLPDPRVFKVLLENVVLLDLKVFKVLLVREERLELKVSREYRDQQDLKVSRVFKVLLVREENKVSRVCKDQQENVVLPVREEHRVFKAFRVYKGQQDLKACKVFPEFKDQQEKEELQDHKV